MEKKKIIKKLGTTKKTAGNNKSNKVIKYDENILQEIALDIKWKNAGKKLSFNFLEQETGISRMTWERKLRGFIEKLNTSVNPGVAALGEDGEVYLPNISDVIELYGNNKKQLLIELLNVEQFYQSVYFELIGKEKCYRSVPMSGNGRFFLAKSDVNRRQWLACETAG